ncbi:MAG: MMPL family transporter [Candidatus Rokubacteria bacterium]|nr:MMPL family transporter [Candidatus Rokubacteria bacterium]
MPRVLSALALRHPLGLAVAAALLAVLGFGLAATRLEFHTSRGALIADGDRSRQLNARYEQEFEELPERVVVAIASDDPESAKGFATALGQRWQRDPDIEQVLARIEPGALKRKGLYYLSPDELVALRGRLETHRDLLRDLVASPTLANLLALINRDVTAGLVARAFAIGGDETADDAVDLAPLLAILRQMNESLADTRPFQSPWPALLGTGPRAASEDGFLRSDDKRLLFVLANPKASAGDFNRFGRAVTKIRADAQDLRRAYPNVEVGITGRAVLESDEMAAAKRDMTLASLISLAGITLLFVVFFKGIVRPAIAAVTLVIGVGWSLGFATLTVGHLNILSIAFLPMLVGLGIDYGIHFVARYEEERSGARQVGAALARTVSGAGRGIATAALTTALGFFALLLTDFKGLAELGLISGSSVLLTALATFVVMPALLVLSEAGPLGRMVPARAGQARADGGYLATVVRYPRLTLTLSALLIGVSVLALGSVRSDFNLLHLQAEGTEAARWAQRIFESASRSVLFEEVAAGSLAEVRRKVVALEVLPSVADVESIASVLPEDQEAKRPLVEAIKPLVADLSFGRVVATSVDVGAVRSTLGRITFKLGGDGAADPDPGDPSLDRDRHEARGLIEAFLATAARRDKADVDRALVAFQERLFGDLREKLGLLTASASASPVTVDDLPPELRARYVGRTGQYRLFVFPSADVWEFAPLARFVEDVRSVDPDAHGTPGRTFEYLRTMREGYERAALYASVAVALVAFLTFRALQPALLALVPLIVGGLWTLGLMGLVGVAFNPANLLLLPLIVGIGIDSGIYVVQRVRESGGAGAPLPRSTGRAITLSALTTMVGFGSLMISGHRGISSLGLVVVLGVGSVLVASLTTLPSLVALLARRRAAVSGGDRAAAVDTGRVRLHTPAGLEAAPAEHRERVVSS